MNNNNFYFSLIVLWISTYNIDIDTDLYGQVDHVQ